MSIKTIPAVPAGKEATGFGPGIARRALGRGMQLPCLCLRLEGDINTAGIIIQVGLLAEHSVRAGCPPSAFSMSLDSSTVAMILIFQMRTLSPERGRHIPKVTQQRQDLNSDPT